MDFWTQNIRPVDRNEQVTYHCSGCGACCKNVGDSIMLSPMDAFYLIKSLWKKEPYLLPADFLEKYAEIKMLSENYPVYVLKTRNDSGHCIFLENNRCSVYECRPFTCRLYPFTLDFDPSGKEDWLLCTEQKHHFCAGTTTPNEWKNKYLSDEYFSFMKIQLREIPKLGKLIRSISGMDAEIQTQVILSHYFLYDYDGDFLSQYESNLKSLTKRLLPLRGNNS